MACAGCPKQRYIPGEPDKLQERDRVEIVEGSCGYRGQYSGKIRFIEKCGVQDEGSRQVAKRNCDPRQAYPEVKPQGRNLVRVVDIVAHFAPLGPVARKNSFYRANRGGGRMGPGDVCWVPKEAVRYGKARQTSESGECWVCRRVLWVAGLWGQCSGKIRFIEKHKVQDERSCHVAKNSSDRRKAYPEVKLQGPDLVQFVGIVTPFVPLGAGILGNFVLSIPWREMGTGAAVRHGRARQTSEPGPCGDCRRVLWVPGP